MFEVGFDKDKGKQKLMEAVAELYSEFEGEEGFIYQYNGQEMVKDKAHIKLVSEDK